VIRRTEQHVVEKYPQITPFLPPKIEFIHSEELERRWPGLTPREREDRISQEAKAVFIIGIGGALANGKPHDGRAPDYDDWSSPTENGRGLNGDIFVWNPILNRGFELSSMGIRVNPESLKRQLEITGFQKERGSCSTGGCSAATCRRQSRRDRPIAPLYAVPAKVAYRRSAVQRLAAGDAGRASSEKRDTAVNCGGGHLISPAVSIHYRTFPVE